MKLGKVLTYKDIDEAKKLVGKKVVYSNCFRSINNFQDCLGIANDLGLLILNEVRDGSGLYYPFRLSAGTVVQFIREVVEDEPDELRYEPYDLSDPKVRDSLRGEWFRNIQEDDDTPERMVTSFECNEDGDEWCVNGIYTASTFLRDCVWIDDGAPCGRLMNMEVR